jgi:uncharacterized protein YwqG
VPDGWIWPCEDQYEEPFWFLAQINCAELGQLARAFGLPSEGLLAFFGDHDDVNGCDPTGGGACFYFPDTSLLAPAALPLDDFTPQISCGLGFYETFELPHPFSSPIEALDLRKEEGDLYSHLWKSFKYFGLSEERGIGDDNSKLFGWPDLVQGELTQLGAHNDSKKARLLLQLGDYHDGTEWHWWGPGGLVFFTLGEKDIAEANFGRAEIEGQCT